MKQSKVIEISIIIIVGGGGSTFSVGNKAIKGNSILNQDPLLAQPDSTSQIQKRDQLSLGQN